MISDFLKRIYFSLDYRINRLRQIPWNRVRGDQTLRFDYDLDENSVVFDLGGYLGEWTEEIFKRYRCNIYVFEPVTEYFEKIKKKFEREPKIKVYDCGLSSRNEKRGLYIKGPGSSVFKQDGKRLDINLIEADDFIKANRVSRIDLMKINIEGGEYELLPHLIDKDLVQKIANIQVQFHSFVPNAKRRMREIQNSLKETHYLTFQYPFVWENWKSRVDICQR